MAPRPQDRKAAFAFAALALSIGVSVALICVILTQTYGTKFHASLRAGKWPVNAYRYNEDMRNFELTPGISKPLLDGSYYLKTHSLGFRIPEYADAEAVRPGGILALGCSFTFGDGVEAQETFVDVAARALGLPAYNYGVSSYSYASSILQLEDLERRGVLARLSPSVVVLGTGSWLLGRSVNPFYPTPDIQLTYPYIAHEGEDLEIVFPADFISVRHAVGFATTTSYFDGENKDVPFDLRRRIRLLDTIPRVLITRVKQRLFENQMTTDELYAFVLARLVAITDKLGARLVILNMPGAPRETTLDEGLRKAIDECDCAILVDGYRSLARRGALRAKLFHPDPRAHAAYAAGLVEAISRDREPGPRP